jgi:hypothetical protein
MVMISRYVAHIANSFFFKFPTLLLSLCVLCNWYHFPCHLYHQVRAFLIGCICDVPMSRKLSGSLAHNARLGCNKCKTVFDEAYKQSPSFDPTSWVPRTNKDHKETADRIKQTSPASRREAMEKETGVR